MKYICKFVNYDVYVYDLHFTKKCLGIYYFELFEI